MIGALFEWLSDVPVEGGWLQIRADPAGLVLVASALIGGHNFFPKALRGVRYLRLDMNFLMTVAIIGALLIGEPVEAAAIAALFSFAELLEAAAVSRARRSIEELVALAPEKARRVLPDGGEEEVVASTLRAGDRVRIRPGEKVPIDGTVLDGTSAVDQSTVTGESVPVSKGRGDQVFAGTLLSEGFLEVEASTDSGNTTLDRIVRLVRQAQSQRAPSERFIERFAKAYTPVVTGIAVLTMLVPPLMDMGTSLDWFTRGLTLLVVACPCALVIATPVTIMTAITSAARHGVLIKGGKHVEKLGAICAFAFDKTGSLTEGRLAVTDVIVGGGANARDVLRTVAAVEKRSEHPLAKAIVAYASGLRIDFDSVRVADFEARPGYGVVARVEGQLVRIGKPNMFEGVSLPPRLADLQGEGKTTAIVAVEDRVIGLIALADRLRPEAHNAIAELRRLGIHDMVMLTGDHERVARHIADQLGIVEVRAGLLPEDKVNAIVEYRREHEGVAMLGDGVNDAPALAVADVGIVMGAAGSPASIETADVALMGDDLRLLPYAVRVGQRARRLLRFNVGLALALKLSLAVGAVLGMVSLLSAVLLGDVGASAAVTINAMRIARLRV